MRQQVRAKASVASWDIGERCGMVLAVQQTNRDTPSRTGHQKSLCEVRALDQMGASCVVCSAWRFFQHAMLRDDSVCEKYRRDESKECERDVSRMQWSVRATRDECKECDNHASRNATNSAGWLVMCWVEVVARKIHVIAENLPSEGKRFEQEECEWYRVGFCGMDSLKVVEYIALLTA